MNLYKRIHFDSNAVSNSKPLSDIFIHQNLKVEKLGPCIDYETPWYAASPDGAVYFTCCGHGVLEIKYPFSLKEKSLRGNIIKDIFYVGVNMDGITF